MPRRNGRQGVPLGLHRDATSFRPSPKFAETSETPKLFTGGHERRGLGCGVINETFRLFPFHENLPKRL